MSKNPKQLPNVLRRAETSVVLIVFNDDLYEFNPHAVSIFPVALHKSGTRKVQTEQVQDKSKNKSFNSLFI